MSTSIMQTRQECYICRAKYNVSTVRGLEEHHVLNGAAAADGRALWAQSLALPSTPQRAGYSAHFDHHCRLWLKKRHRPLLRPDMDTSAGWLKPERII